MCFTHLEQYKKIIKSIPSSYTSYCIIKTRVREIERELRVSRGWSKREGREREREGRERGREGEKEGRERRGGRKGRGGGGRERERERERRGNHWTI